MKNSISFVMTAVLVATAMSTASFTILEQASPAFADDDYKIIITDNSTNQECGEQDTCFSNSGAIINRGQTVTWENKDYVIHSVKSKSHETGSDGLFSSMRIVPGNSFSQIFSESGFYNYYCPSHPWMNGAILVR